MNFVELMVMYRSSAPELTVRHFKEMKKEISITRETLFIIYHEIFFTSDICEAIHVTGDNSTSNSEGGLYLLSDERSSDAPNNPVWKNSAGNHFIFTTGSSDGWRIGAKSSLADGSYYCKGKHILILSPIASTYI